jgi:alpha-N-arabinofuranosidase
MMYERLSPDLAMSCPALLLRNTTDDPLWRAFIYHDHMTWFPGSGYVVEKLFREHYAPKHFASTSGTFREIPNRKAFFDDIAQMKPEDWRPGTFDAIAAGSADGKRIVIKAVNYEGNRNTLLARLQGSAVPANAEVVIYTVRAGLMDAPSLENPDRIKAVQSTVPYARDLTIDLPPYTVAVIEIAAK